MKNELFRVSFSVLAPWASGNWDEAVKRYLKIPTPVTPAMEDGSLFHKQWQTETLEKGTLPSVFGGSLLQMPSPELKLECVIDGWLQFVGIIDCIDGDTIHEYKTGHASSLTYARTMQTPCYQVLTTLNGYNPTQAIIHHFNQHTKQVTRSKIYLSEHTYARAKEWIVTYASELREALRETGQL